MGHGGHGQRILKVTRNRVSFGSRVPAEIYANGAMVGFVENGSFADVFIPAGPCQIQVIMPSRPDLTFSREVRSNVVAVPPGMNAHVCAINLVSTLLTTRMEISVR
jgi:hypothetical protein